MSAIYLGLFVHFEFDMLVCGVCVCVCVCQLCLGIIKHLAFPVLEDHNKTISAELSQILEEGNSI